MNPKHILEHYEINPKKSLGQNFMHDPNALEKIVTTAELMPEDTVVEIGPGTGGLTAKLAQMARRVVAVELDERLVPVLEERFAEARNVYLVFNDILKTNVAQLVGPKPYVVVANVPYYITSEILRYLLETEQRPQRIVITMQYEVAERIVAKPGDLSLLGVSVQYFGVPRIVGRLKPAVFWPRPGIDSAILRIDTHPQPIVDVPSDKLFFRVVRAGFSQKRKQLKNSLSGGLQMKSKVAGDYLAQAGIDASRRAETLTLDEWALLTRTLAPGLS
jgi:16S rRNA (adenine1518-N6/adenine1519-N6)-dimethyltransferase